MAHNAEEAQEDERTAQQTDTLANARCLVGTLLLNGSGCEHDYRQETDDGVDYEQAFPSQSECRHGTRGSPCRYQRGEERGYRLDKLPEGERRCQLAFADKVGHQRIERCLHDGIAYAEQRKRKQHHHVTVAENGHNERRCRHYETYQHCVLAPYTVHQHSGGHREYEEPEEYERRKQVGL